MGDTEDKTVKKVRKWVTISSIIIGALTTLGTPLLVMYIEYAPQVRKARGEAEAGYEAMVPAVVELQTVVEEGQEWVRKKNAEIKVLIANQEEMEGRLDRCEAYMEELSKKRNLPKPPPRDKPSPEPTSVMMSPMHDDLEQTQLQYKLPPELSGAKKKAEKRAKLKCRPDDPTCGEAE